ncbi:hypothetical protein ACOBQX_00085 [Actinokineospora sp. G85]|uniref:hypothetical protein n=1 Tax=Actinokineospora sp. G85 TaxID=3406626 RepID=UPI003C776715
MTEELAHPPRDGARVSRARTDPERLTTARRPTKLDPDARDPGPLDATPHTAR